MSTPHIPGIADHDGVLSEALRLIQDRAPQVLNAIDDGVVFLDPKGHVIFVNESASRILRFTNREMLGKSMHALVHHHYADGSAFPEEDCPILSSLTDAVQQRVGGDSFWTKAGTAVPVDYTSIPIKEGRVVAGVVVTFRDISDQQRAEEQGLRLRREREARAEAERAREALRDSEERYRFMSEAIPVQIWTATPDGRLDYVTQRVSNFFGIPAEQLLRDGWKDVVHPDDLQDVGTKWAHSLATGDTYKVEFRLRRHDGVYRWYLGRALAQRDEQGGIVKWFGTNTDIEEQKQGTS